jgi:beta-lactamase superfamily II metal-dependent hydrolase
LTVVDVGHGNAAVLTGPDGTVLIDAGPGASIMEYLETEGLLTIDAVAITHADEDHLRGLVGVIDSETVKVGSVRVNSDAEQGSRLWNATTFSLSQKSEAGAIDFQVSLAVGDQLPTVAKGVTVEILAPSKYLAAKGPGSVDNEGRQLGTNSVSGVLRVLVDSAPHVLLAADIDRVGLENLLADQEINARILLFPHHGGNCRPGASADENKRFTQQLLEAVTPELVIFSLGRGRYETPRREIIEAVHEAGAEVKIACTQLSETCAADLPPSSAFGHLLGTVANGAASRACCAGTIRIPLVGEILPNQQAYEVFKEEYAESALCRRVLPMLHG